MKRVLVAGEINVDLVFRGLQAFPAVGTEVLCDSFAQVPGSSSMICAMGLARLGQPVGFIGKAGQDAFGDFCIAAMAGRGIDTGPVMRDPGLATGVTASLSGVHDRALVTFAGSIDALAADEIDDALLASADHLHVSSYYLQRALRPGCQALFARARAAGLTISLDPGFDPDQQWGDDILALLDWVDLFLPNDRELLAITGTDAIDAGLQALSSRSALTVVKCGSAGAVAKQAGIRIAQAGFAVEARDTTGAGDSFDAGFLHAWLGGHPLPDCMRWGNACGSLSTRAAGGTAAQADLAEARRLLDQQA